VKSRHGRNTENATTWFSGRVINIIGIEIPEGVGSQENVVISQDSGREAPEWNGRLLHRTLRSQISKGGANVICQFHLSGLRGAEWPTWRFHKSKKCRIRQIIGEDDGRLTGGRPLQFDFQSTEQSCHFRPNSKVERRAAKQINKSSAAVSVSSTRRPNMKMLRLDTIGPIQHWPSD
jgi:hypothetical protein